MTIVNNLNMISYIRIGFLFLLTLSLFFNLAAQNSITLCKLKAGSLLQMDSVKPSEYKLYLVDILKNREFIGSIRFRPVKWDVMFYTNYSRMDQKNISIIFVTEIGMSIFFNSLRMLDHPNYYDDAIYNTNKWIIISNELLTESLPFKDQKIIESVKWHTPTLFTLIYKEYTFNGVLKRTPSQTFLCSSSDFILLPECAVAEISQIEYRNEILENYFK